MSGGPAAFIEMEDSVAPPHGWVIGAAPKQLPYWALLDATGSSVARLYLLFSDHDHARRRLGAELDHWDPELKAYIRRTMYDLQPTAAAVLRAVKHATEELRGWAHGVVSAGRGTLIPGILEQHLDIALLPRELAVIPGRLAIVDEQAFSSARVRCVIRPRPLTWST